MENELKPRPKQKSPITFFSTKTKRILHPSLRVNDNIVSETTYQKHLGIFLDAELMFEKLLKIITTKVNKTIRLL